MHPKSNSQTTWGIIFLVLSSALAIVAELSDLLDRFHIVVILMSVFSLAGISVSVQTWLHRKTETASFSLSREKMVETMNQLKETMLKPSTTAVDIGGLSLRSAFFKRNGTLHKSFVRMLKGNRNLKVRVWLLEPDSNVCKLREMAEREHEEGSLKEVCKESLETLSDILVELRNENLEDQLRVVLVDQNAITHSIFRVDNEMLVTQYLQHGTGSESPCLYINSSSPWFKVYLHQFERCFSLNQKNLFQAPDLDFSRK